MIQPFNQIYPKVVLCLLFHFLAIDIHAQERIIILNEGTWQADNGKLSFFESGKIVSNQWFRDNNKSKLGDTPNDIIQINENLIAIALNWSNIIQFITPAGKATAATEDIPNNRRLATDGRYLYVTSYGHECGNVNKGIFKQFTKGFVAKIDIQSYELVDAIEVGYEPEGIVYYNGYLFVANTGGYASQENHDYESSISIINAENFVVERTIDTGAINLFGDMTLSGQYILVNSAGDYMNTSASSLIVDCDKAIIGDIPCVTTLSHPATYSCACPDGSILSIGSSFSYKDGTNTFYSETLDPSLIYSSNGKQGVKTSLPGTMSSDIAKFKSPYSIYVNPYTGYLYATDASSYSDGGKLYQWNPDGKLINSWKVGINPGHLLALPPDGEHFSGIQEWESESHQSMDYYDLQGRMIHTPEKSGIYITKNKVIIKR